MKAENKLHILGVCASHFIFDQNILHSLHLKQQRSVEKSWIYYRRYLFCNKYRSFFSRGNNCIEHSVYIMERNIQVPCIGLKTYSIFKDINKSNNDYQSRYICSECFNLEGGHFFKRQGSENKIFSCADNHKDDTTKFLELIGQWILNTAAFGEENQKEKLLMQLNSIFNININQQVSKTQDFSNQQVHVVTSGNTWY
jgi:hypothetical protein